MALRYLLNPRRKTFRVAVVVSRKVSKSAVVRNRIRRRLYELLRNYQGQINQPYDLVLTVFSDQIAELPVDKLSKSLHAQLLKAKLIAPATDPQRDIVKAKES
jgi:ribonuclease P protein component